MRRLGIDHGERRVGLALSDEDGRIAQPLDTLERNDPKQLLRTIATLATSEAVAEIVVGLPLNLDGTEGTSARRARRFAERLAEESALPVVLWDERLTTAAAQRVLVEGGVRASDQKRMVDRVAAAILLQSYLDSRAVGRDRTEGSENEGDEPWLASDSAPAEAPEPARSGRGRRRGRSRGR
jgi:putative Holliday junction resolvase